MRTVTDKAEVNSYLRNVKHGITDLSGWQDWYVLEIAAPADFKWKEQANISSVIETLLPNCNGSVLWLKNSIIVFFQKSGFDSAPFSSAIQAKLGMPGVKTQLLSIGREYEQLLTLVDRHIDHSLSTDISPADCYAYLKTLVPQVDALLKEWHTISKGRSARAKPDVMVVDDDPLMLKMACMALEKDCKPITASNGVEAITKHLQFAPDIVFLDIGLPDCNGQMLLQCIQQYDPECYIVMFTADNDIKTRLQSFAEGADGYIAKPFNREAFKNHLAAWNNKGGTRKNGKK